MLKKAASNSPFHTLHAEACQHDDAVTDGQWLAGVSGRDANVTLASMLRSFLLENCNHKPQLQLSAPHMQPIYIGMLDTGSTHIPARIE